MISQVEDIAPAWVWSRLYSLSLIIGGLFLPMRSEALPLLFEEGGSTFQESEALERAGRADEINHQGRDDEARIWLRYSSFAIEGDVQTYCQIRMEVIGEAVPLSRGDTVEIWVRERDLLRDDLLFHSIHEVTQAEANAGRLSLTQNCSGRYNADDEEEAHVDLYATAEVLKAECGLLCFQDRPTSDRSPGLISSNFSVSTQYVNDDAEDSGQGDDQRARAHVIDRDYMMPNDAFWISRDDDYRAVELLGQSSIEASLTFRPEEGLLSLTLLNERGNLIATAEQNETGSGLRTEVISPGIYYLRVRPIDNQNGNFYRLRVESEAQAIECRPLLMQSRDCGNCGQQRRRCSAESQWQSWGACLNQGACPPGTESLVDCGFCGRAIQRCNAECQWIPAECEAPGECLPGDESVRACDEGTETRQCDEQCIWSEYGPCIACADGDERACYEGEPGTAGVGDCQEGVQRCAQQGWGACLAQQLPMPESCADEQDNDCDGHIDLADPDCRPQCGNGNVEGMEECDSLADDCEDCRVLAVDASGGGTFRGGFQAQSFDRFLFRVQQPVRMSFRTHDLQDQCSFQTHALLYDGRGDVLFELRGGDGDDCVGLADLQLDPDDYLLEIFERQRHALPEYRLTVEWIDLPIDVDAAITPPDMMTPHDQNQDLTPSDPRDNMIIPPWDAELDMSGDETDAIHGGADAIESGDMSSIRRDDADRPSLPRGDRGGRADMISTLSPLDATDVTLNTMPDAQTAGSAADAGCTQPCHAAPREMIWIVWGGILGWMGRRRRLPTSR